jgi:hypothetical protein
MEVPFVLVRVSCPSNGSAVYRNQFPQTTESHINKSESICQRVLKMLGVLTALKTRDSDTSLFKDRGQTISPTTPPSSPNMLPLKQTGPIQVTR